MLIEEFTIWWLSYMFVSMSLLPSPLLLLIAHEIYIFKLLLVWSSGFAKIVHKYMHT